MATSRDEKTSLVSEDLLLLMLDDAKGTSTAFVNSRMALGGALLVDLAMAGLVTAEPRRGALWSNRLRAVEGAQTDDPLLGAALDRLTDKPRGGQPLVLRVGKFDGKTAQEHIAERLSERGVLRRRNGRALLVFPYTVWPTVDAQPEEALRARIADALERDHQPTLRTAAVIALLRTLHQTRLVGGADAGRTSKDISRRAREITDVLRRQGKPEHTAGLTPEAAAEESVANAIAAALGATATALAAVAGAGAG